MAKTSKEQEVTSEVVEEVKTEEVTEVTEDAGTVEDAAPVEQEHHSPKYYDYKEYYETGRWTRSMLKVAVKKYLAGKTAIGITPEEYKEITGRDYK